MRKTAGAVALALSLTLYVAAPASAATWSVVASPNLTQFDNVLWGVDAVSVSSAWAVGRADTGTVPVNRPVIERWNGTSWAISPSPLPPGGGELRDVHATSTSRAWAVGFTHTTHGFGTLTERWNGSQWRVVASPNVGAQNFLLGVRAFSGTQAWAVGSHDVPGSLAFSTLAQRWNGTSWTTVPTPDTARFENHLTAVDGTSATDVWAVGHTSDGDYSVRQPLAMHWDGSSWTIVPTPSGRDASLEGVATLAPNDVWAVGSTFSLSLLWHVPFALHWDGRQWTEVAVPTPSPQGGRLADVTALSPTRVYAVGQAGGTGSLVMRWNGQRWAMDATSNAGTVWDAASVGPGTVWTVGQRGTPNIGTGRTFVLRATNG